jgi:hypothetical protein
LGISGRVGAGGHDFRNPRKKRRGIPECELDAPGCPDTIVPGFHGPPARLPLCRFGRGPGGD